jgi:hypothetical protein
MAGWMDVKAVLRIAYSNKKSGRQLFSSVLKTFFIGKKPLNFFQINTKPFEIFFKSFEKLSSYT